MVGGGGWAGGRGVYLHSHFLVNTQFNLLPPYLHLLENFHDLRNNIWQWRLETVADLKKGIKSILENDLASPKLIGKST